MTTWITKAVPPESWFATSSGFIANRDMAMFSQQINISPLPYKIKNVDHLNDQELSNEIDNVFSLLSSEDIVFVQYPLWTSQRYEQCFMNRLLARKDVKIVLIIWDVIPWLFDNRVRDFTEENCFRLMNQCALIIAPNKKMASRIKGQGGVTTSIIDIGISDYFCVKNNRNEFKKMATFVGSLDKTDFTQCCGKTIINLIGDPSKLTEKEKNIENLNIMGIINNHEIPCLLDKGFGLMSYDNNGLLSGKNYFCAAQTYGKYNNPLKLSLYLAAGLPVIIDRQAAHARLIEKFGMGILMDDLSSLDTVISAITPEMYDRMQDNVERLGEALRTGFFTRRVISKALKRLNYPEQGRGSQHR